MKTRENEICFSLAKRSMRFNDLFDEKHWKEAARMDVDRWLGKRMEQTAGR